ncbi:MAG: hypothetical protein IKQ80_04615 [Clostridia bacterium]|nr:hypothetical protein [Clostridia bacterium]
MERIPVRKKNRLSSVTYAENGAYFITVCTKDKRNLFWSVGAAMRRPHLDLPAEGGIDQPAMRRPHLDLPAEGGMDQPAMRRPHLDLPAEGGMDQSAMRRPPNCLSSLGRIADDRIRRIHDIYDGFVLVDHYVVMPNHVHLLLRIETPETGGRRIAAPTIMSVVNQYKGAVSKGAGFPCWQKSFHDHIVRNEADYRRIWEYIDSNPGRWEEDCYFLSDDW